MSTPPPLDTSLPRITFSNGNVFASLSYILVGGSYIPWDGSVSVEVTSSGAAIQDGVDPSIVATVIDYIHGDPTPASANPLGVILVGTDGVPYNASGGGGGLAVTVIDGGDVTQGAIADVKVVGDNSGTVNAHLRGIDYLLALVTDIPNTRLNVSVANSTLPSGAATSANQSTEITALQLIDNPVGSLTGGSAGTASFAAGGIYNTSLPTLTNTQQCALQLDVNGKLIVSVGTVTITGSVTVTGTVTANAGTNLNTSLLALESGGNLAAVNTVLGAIADAAVTAGATGSISAKLRSISRDLVANIVLAAGNNNIGDVDVATIPGIVGTIADDSTTPGNPVMVGGVAKNSDGTSPGFVSAEDDVIRFIGTRQRIQYVEDWNPSTVKYHLDTSTAQTDTQIAAAPGSNKQVIIDFIQFTSNAATAINLFLEEGSTKIFGPIALEAVAGRGYVSGKMRLPITANTAVTFTTSASIAQAIDIQYHIEDV